MRLTASARSQAATARSATGAISPSDPGRVDRDAERRVEARRAPARTRRRRSCRRRCRCRRSRRPARAAAPRGGRSGGRRSPRRPAAAPSPRRSRRSRRRSPPSWAGPARTRSSLPARLAALDEGGRPLFGVRMGPVGADLGPARFQLLADQDAFEVADAPCGCAPWRRASCRRSAAGELAGAGEEVGVGDDLGDQSGGQRARRRKAVRGGRAAPSG